MFRDHQPKIQAFAQESADNWARVAQFVILTVRQPLYNVAADIETAENGGNEAMGVLFGWKFDAYNHAWIYREDFHAVTLEIQRITPDNPTLLAHRLLELYTAAPGFGLAKAGFLAQLCAGVSGCLDTHNLRRLEISPHAFAHIKRRKRLDTRRKMITRYQSAIDNAGGTEALWDQWCAYVAERSPNVYKSPDHVSALHCEALGL